MFYDQIILKGIKFAIVPERNEEDGFKLSFGIDKKYLYIKKYNHKNRSMTYTRYKLAENCGSFEPWNNIIPKHSKKGQVLVKDKWKKLSIV